MAELLSSCWAFSLYALFFFLLLFGFFFCLAASELVLLRLLRASVCEMKVTMMDAGPADFFLRAGDAGTDVMETQLASGVFFFFKPPDDPAGFWFTPVCQALGNWVSLRACEVPPTLPSFSPCSPA